jgi:BASS family bile acid:Na+ symporter
MEALLSLAIILIFSFLGLYTKEFFINLKPFVVPMLAFVMLSMGLTMQVDDLLQTLKKPFRIAYGALLQFSIMPFLGYFLAKILSVNTELTVGAVLVGSAPGGTASNVITYLSKGDLAYSVSMTTFSTLVSPIMTPLITYLLVGRKVDVPVIDMLRDLIFIVVLPVALGIFIKRFLLSTKAFEKVLPYMAIVAIGIIIAVVLALNSERLKDLSMQVFLLVFLHNFFGFLLGYIFGLLAGLDKVRAKTLSIEVGIQNSGLAVVLALKYFSSLSALPGALFSLVQNVNGLLLSALYRKL